jgi:hypothetical protein
MTKLKFDCLELAKELIPSLGITSKNELFALADDLYNYCSTGIESEPLKISKAHLKFSELLNKPDALKNPEKYLGPNVPKVLDFWNHIETLSYEEKKKMNDLYWDLDDYVRNSAKIASIDAVREVVGWEFRSAAWRAAWDVTGWVVFGDATYELIAHHKLIEQNKTPTFLPLCAKP